jgi:FkbM family methyltransferase
MSSIVVFGQPLSWEEVARRIEAAGSHLGMFAEVGVRAAYEAWVQPGDTAVDGGAAQGLHTAPLLRQVGATGCVHAFEALPEQVETLRQKIAMWRFPGRAYVHNCALATENGETGFVRVVGSPGYSGIRHAWAGRDLRTESITVASRRLEDAIPSEDAARLSFIKLDLEGAEFTALSGGAARLLERRRPLIVFENARAAAARLYGYTEADFFGFFGRLGYTLFNLLGVPFGPDQWTGPFAPPYLIAHPPGSAAEPVLSAVRVAFSRGAEAQLATASVGATEPAEALR